MSHWDGLVLADILRVGSSGGKAQLSYQSIAEKLNLPGSLWSFGLRLTCIHPTYTGPLKGSGTVTSSSFNLKMIY